MRLKQMESLRLRVPCCENRLFWERVMQIDLPEVIAEVKTEFERYEQALISNDIATLNEMFRNDARTIRYGLNENLYGYGEIAAFRAARSPSTVVTCSCRSVVPGYYWAPADGTSGTTPLADPRQDYN